jgi:hypothetical protein
LSGQRRVLSKKEPSGSFFVAQLQIGAIVLTFGVSILPTKPALQNINHCVKCTR